MAYNQNHKGHNNPKQSYPKGYKGELIEDFYNPYSFVPLADAPCFLSDEDAIRLMFAQDIPYSDGKCGHIDVHFKAETPVCVKHDSKSPDSINIRGRYFIPGSSVKGMLRNVLEILSMSNIRNVMADDRYSMRDLGKNSRYSLKAETEDGEKAGGQKPGFLFMINDEFFIMPCSGKAVQVHYADMPEHLRRTLQNSKAKVEEKYKASGNNGVTTGKGSNEYMWLFSGYMQSKLHEYMLPIPDFTGKPVALKDNALKDFLFIHEEENDNKSWKYWKRRIEGGKYHSLEDVAASHFSNIAPCFFRTKIENGEEVVRDLGFAFLYREPFKYSLSDMLLDEYKSDKVDIASSIFGFTRPQSLKGRVQVQNAFIADASVDTERCFILGSPKPTFYPFYLEQPDEKNLFTYSDSEAVISGWKRYLVHEDALPSAVYQKENNALSKFSPLKKGTEFIVRINYHNLRPYELGALIAAVTFNGNENCFHSLGYAKPFGYGKLSVTKIEADFNIRDYLEIFRKKVCSMSGMSKAEWEYYLGPLIDIASGSYKKEKIRYPHLDKDENGTLCKEFALIKDKKKRLSDFSPVDE